MKRKTKAFIKFAHDLHEFIISDPQFRQDTSSRSESEIQAEIRPLIIKYLEQYFENAAGRVYRYYPGPGRHWGGVVGTWRRGAQRAGTAWSIVHLVKRLPGPGFPAGWHGKGQVSAPGTPAQGTKPSGRVGFYRVTGFCRGWVHSCWALNLCRLNNLSPMDRLCKNCGI